MMNRKILCLLFCLPLIFSCTKYETEAFGNFQPLDFSSANDSLGEACREGVIIKSEAEFNTLMTQTGNSSLAFPGLSGTELILIQSFQIDQKINYWHEVYKIVEGDQAPRYQVMFVMDAMSGDGGVWRTLAMKVDFGNQDAQISFVGRAPSIY